MRMVDVIGGGPGSPAIARAKIAGNVWSRFWGLMLRGSLPEGEGLIIDPCYSVHTLFMRFPIDVVFLDRENRVLKVAENLRPFRASIGRGARKVLELPAGSARRAGVRVGDVMTIKRDA